MVKMRRNLMLKLFSISILALIVLGVASFLIGPILLPPLKLRATFKGAHFHEVGGEYRMCLIFEVKNPRSSSVNAEIEIDLSAQDIPASAVKLIIDGKTGRSLKFRVKGEYLLVIELHMLPNEVRVLHVIL